MRCTTWVVTIETYLLLLSYYDFTSFTVQIIFSSMLLQVPVLLFFLQMQESPSLAQGVFGSHVRKLTFFGDGDVCA